MPIELKTEHENVLIVRVSGKLTKDDYSQFIPQVDRLIAEQGMVSVLFDMRDLHAWELAAAWEDAKFALHHFRDISCLAVVGKKKWQKVMAVFCKPFTRAEVRYFTVEQFEQAHHWLLENTASQTR